MILNQNLDAVVPRLIISNLAVLATTVDIGVRAPSSVRRRGIVHLSLSSIRHSRRRRSTKGLISRGLLGITAPEDKERSNGKESQEYEDSTTNIVVNPIVTRGV